MTTRLVVTVSLACVAALVVLFARAHRDPEGSTVGLARSGSGTSRASATAAASDAPGGAAIASRAPRRGEPTRSRTSADVRGAAPSLPAPPGDTWSPTPEDFARADAELTRRWKLRDDGDDAAAHEIAKDEEELARLLAVLRAARETRERLIAHAVEIAAGADDADVQAEDMVNRRSDQLRAILGPDRFRRFLEISLDVAFSLDTTKHDRRAPSTDP